ncbi:MAG: sigma-54-dependent Fis family transcriptional regulator [Deltaproteobacteria bacterium]|nr:sigma-54-dependent Fis family transcriptional regulator [Deltaproteobacteria bacterium]
MTARVVVIDDQESARDLFGRFLDPKRFEVVPFASAPEALAYLEENDTDVVVTDLRMPGMDGMEGLQRCRERCPDVPVIMVTAHASVETAVEAMRHGAYDYIKKPFEPGEMELIVGRAAEHRRLLRENRNLRVACESRFAAPNIIGQSAVMARVFDLVAKVAPLDVTVLVEGESGTGKDLIARAIHARSRRAAGAYVSLNCAAIPDSLLESELFGYEKGAFSGATGERPGFFAAADGGTLFLDEIGDLGAALQPKLLRVLQDGTYYPVGGRKIQRADVRVIAATNQDLGALVEAGRFRADLYYRINGVTIVLPPLRARPEDIPLLATHFVERACARFERRPLALLPEVQRRLLDYRWPGNVRELEHALERAVLVAQEPALRLEDLPAELQGAGLAPAAGSPVAGAASPPTSAGAGLAAGPDGALPSFRDAREEFEREYLKAILAASGGNVTEAAERAGLHRATLYEKLSRLGIKAP